MWKAAAAVEGKRRCGAGFPGEEPFFGKVPPPAPSSKGFRLMGGRAQGVRPGGDIR